MRKFISSNIFQRYRFSISFILLITLTILTLHLIFRLDPDFPYHSEELSDIDILNNKFTINHYHRDPLSPKPNPPDNKSQDHDNHKPKDPKVPSDPSGKANQNRSETTQNPTYDNVPKTNHSYHKNWTKHDYERPAKEAEPIKKSKMRTKNEGLQWKENLRNRINQEEPGLYYLIDQPIPSKEIYSYVDFKSLIKVMEVSVFFYGEDHLNIIIRDADTIRWEYPFEEPFPFIKIPKSQEIKQSKFDIKITKDPFTFTIIRKSTSEIIFELIEPLIFSDLYIEFNFQLPTREIHGFGERLYWFDFQPGTYTEYMRDRSGDIETGHPGFNAHGHHPVYIVKEQSGCYHVNYIRNSNGQEFTLNKNNQIRYRMIGGVLDFNFFLGTNPEEAVKKYHQYLGGWTVPSFWAMGKHQSKWLGYNSAEELRNVMDMYTKSDLPLDVVWSDIEYQIDKINFSFDRKHFPTLSMREIFQRFNKRWIPVINNWIMDSEEAYSYTYPNFMNLTYRVPEGGYYKAYMFRDYYFLDFWHPQAKDFWFKMLDKLRLDYWFSGIWIDANENTRMLIKDEKVVEGKYYHAVPWWPGEENWYHVNMPRPDLFYANGAEEYDGRDTQCILQAKYSYEYLKQQQKTRFPFVLTRGNVPGIGKYAFHFYPDYKSDWTTLKISISLGFNANLFGMAFVGGDLCGNGGAYRTPGELCARWYQLGIWYPFVRNHHMFRIWDNNYQEPYQYEGIYFESMKISLKYRYAILKYYYSVFFSADPLEGQETRVGMVYKPLRFVFYDDPNLPEYGSEILMTQFMIGDGLMVAPIYKEDEFSRKVYFPPGAWYDLRTLKTVEKSKSGSLNIPSKLDELAPHFLRGGNMFYLQSTHDVLSTNNLNNEFDFIVGLEERLGDSAWAHGKIMDLNSYTEENVYQECVLNSCLLDIVIQFDYGSNRMVMACSRRQPTENRFLGVKVNQIILLGHGFKEFYFTKVIMTQGYDTDNTYIIETKFNLTNEALLFSQKDKKFDIKDGTRLNFDFYTD